MPDQIIAYHLTNGVTDVAHPICPYPALPQYREVGDSTKAPSLMYADDGYRDDNQPTGPEIPQRRR